MGRVIREVSRTSSVLAEQAPVAEVDTQAQLESIFGATAPAPERTPAEKDYFGSGIIEPARAIASGTVRQVASGYALLDEVLRSQPELNRRIEGILDAEGYRVGDPQRDSRRIELLERRLPGTYLTGLERGVQRAEEIQAGAFQPKTESGQRNIQRIGEAVDFATDVVRVPLATVAAGTELLTGQGLEQARETGRNVLQEGYGVTAAERVLEETGSPLLATIAQTAPDIVASIAGIKTVKSTPRIRPSTPSQTAIAQKIAQGSDDPAIAKYNLPEAPTKKVNDYVQLGAPRIVKDNTATNAISKGFDEGIVATIKGSSELDKAAMQKMVDIYERGTKSAKYKALNRPSDVVGDTLLNRYDIVYKKNKEAGARLENVAKSELIGKNIDATEAYFNLIDNLEGYGVSISDDLKLNFDGSEFNRMKAVQNTFKNIFDRFKQIDTADAYELHRLKRFIDNQVTYGKSKEGFPGDAERIMKSFRSAIDEALDNFSPKYNRVNTEYSDTIGVMDTIQDAVGRKLNFQKPSADKALGTTLRRLLSNVQSRGNYLDAISELEGVARKYGGKIDDDIITQILFADELDRVFGPTARTSFQGQIAQAMERGIPTSTTGIAVEAAKAGARRAFRTASPEARIQAIKDLLKAKGK